MRPVRGTDQQNKTHKLLGHHPQVCLDFSTLDGSLLSQSQFSEWAVSKEGFHGQVHLGEAGLNKIKLQSFQSFNKSISIERLQRLGRYAIFPTLGGP